MPLFLAGSATGGFLAAFVAASIAMLWLPPARAWFTGKSPTAASPSAAARQPATVRRTTGTAPAGVRRRRRRGRGTARPGRGRPRRPARLPRPTAPSRPGAVVAACVITWVCCAMASVIGVLLLAVLAVDTDGLFTELHRQNPQLGEDVSDALLETVTWATAIVCVVWSLTSSGLAVLAFRRVRWAAYGLVVSAGLVAVLCLAGSVASPVLVVPGVLAAAAAVLLLQGRAHRWFTTREEPWRPSS